MERIRFSQFVLNAIAVGRSEFAESFMGPDYIANKSRMQRQYKDGSGVYPFALEKAEPDDWDLFVGGSWFGFFPDVTLQRGKERFNVDLTKDEKRALSAAFHEMESQRKIRWKEEKAERERKRVDAAWWP